MGKVKTTKQSKRKIDSTENYKKPETKKNLDNTTWEKKLFELNGMKQELSYQLISGQESSGKYEFGSSELKIYDGISIVLDGASGQVSTNNNEVDNSGDDKGNSGVIFHATGGKLKFQPKNMEYLKKQEVALEKVSIILSAVEQPEISAIVKDTITLEPYPGLKMELKQGQYVKGDFEFKNTTVSYADKDLKKEFVTKLDDRGLLLEEGKELSININSFWPANDVREQAGNKLDIEAFLVLDEIQGAYIRMEHTGLLKMGETIFKLKDWVLKDNVFESASEATTVYNKFPLHLTGVTVGGNETYLKAKDGFIKDWNDESKIKGELKDVDFQMDSDQGIMKAASADITLEQEPVHMLNVSFNPGHELQADVAKGTFNGKEVDMTYVHLGEELMLHAEKADAEIEGFRTQMKNYYYKKVNGFSYENADVNVRLNRGLNRDDKDSSEDRAKQFVQFAIGKAENLKSDFSIGTESEYKISINHTLKEVGGSESKDIMEKEENVFTRDGFAKLETGVIDFQKTENESAKVVGKGDFKILEMPYIVTSKSGKKKAAKKAFGPEETKKNIEFTIDTNGTINADFGNEDEVEMNIGRSVENGSENIINKITLGGLSIEDGYLKASSLIKESGFGFESEVEEDESASEALKKLKRIFGECSFSGTFANTAGSVNITENGIEAQEGETTPGTLSVGGLFGFFGGSINFPKGEVEVKAEKEVEGESDNGILKIQGESLIGDGVKIPIGAWPIFLEMGVKPSASIGGEIALKASRGKSFDEDLVEGDNLELGGELKVKGKAGIGVFLGLIAEAVIASADLKLNGNLEAEVKGELKGGAKLGVNQKGKLEQSEDFKFSGGVEGALNSSLSLSSDVKLLFWKAQLFEIKLAEKELGKLSFQGEGSKEKGKNKFTEGWKFDEMGLSFEGMGKQTKLLIKKGTQVKDGQKVNGINEIVENSSKAADNAWAALAQLKEKRDNVIYAVSESEKAAMADEIEKLTADVIGKIVSCIKCLQKQQDVMEKEAKKLEAKAFGKEETMNKSISNVNEAEHIIDSAYAGGFKNGVTKFTSFYDNELYKMAMAQLTHSMIMGEYKKGIERHKSSLEDTVDYDELLGEYKEYTTYKRMMEAKVIDGSRTLKDFKFCSSYYDFIMMNDPVLIDKQLDELSKINKKNDDQIYLEEKLLKQKKKRNGKDLTVFDLLQAAIYGSSGNARTNEVDGQTLYASPEEKYKLIEVCSKLTMNEPKKRENESLSEFSKRKKQFKKANSYLIDSIDEQYQKVFSRSYSYMSKFSVGNDAGTLFRDVEDLKRKREYAIAEYNLAKENLKKKTESINKIKNKKDDYNKKLELLAENADKALVNKKFDEKRAEIAMNILTKDYGEKMKGGKEMLAALSSDYNSKKVVDSIMKGNNPLPSPVNIG